MLTPALRDLLDAHRALSAEARALAAIAAGGGCVRRGRLRRLARALAAQQRVEQAVVLPALAAADPTFDATALVADHAEVTAAARALAATADPAAIVRLARLVELHHADEEAAVVPRWALLPPAADRSVGRALRRARSPLGRARLR